MANSCQVLLLVSSFCASNIQAHREWEMPDYGQGNRVENTQTVIVQTELGKLEGIRATTGYSINGTITDTYDVFRGVPYALPPVGIRRFEAPQPAESWTGIRNATRHGKVCPQDEHVWINARWPRGEDCLSLSIYTPYMANKTGDNQTFPVIFFIHGGSYEVGSERMYDGGVLSLFGVVVVMINYRLGLLGFLTAGNDIVPGNYGLLDQIEALKWVKKNIHSFRGDPDNITLMGQSVGSSSVGLLLVSPLARGLFHRAIMQSGAVLARYSYQSRDQMNITQHFVEVGLVHGCHSTDVENIRDCMKQLHWKRIISSRHRFPINDPVVPEFRPIIDGHVIPSEPVLLFNDYAYWKVPVLHGVVKGELSHYTFWDRASYGEATDYYSRSISRRVSSSLYKTFAQSYSENLVQVINNRYSTWSPTDGTILQYSKMIEDYDFVVPMVVLSELLSQSNDQVYQYYFSAVSDSYHLVDLYYVFGTPYSNKQCCHEIRWFGEEDRNISNTMMRLWTEFASTGRITIDHEPVPPYKPNTKGYLHIEKDGLSVKIDLHGPIVEFWTYILLSLVRNSTNNTISSDYSAIKPQPTAAQSSTSFLAMSERSALLTVFLGVLSFLMALTSVVLFIVVCCNKRKPQLQHEAQHTVV